MGWLFSAGTPSEPIWRCLSSAKHLTRLPGPACPARDNVGEIS
jgi:hypothetical protein